MHLKPAHAKRFTRLLSDLIEYANEEFDVVGMIPKQPVDSGSNDSSMALILNEIWDDDEIIESYLEDNPSSLGSHDLASISNWKYALHGDFILIKHENGYSYFSRDGKIYAVIGISEDISKLVQETPCYVSTTLLPFEGYIVFDSQISKLRIALHASLKETVEQQYQTAKDNDAIIRTAATFIEDDLGLNDWDDLLDDELRSAGFLHPTSRRAANGKPGGTHRGRLAGLSPEDRRAEVIAYDKELDNDPIYGEETYFKQDLAKLPKGVPPDNILGALQATTRERLAELAKALDIPGYYKLKKAELVELFNDNTVAYDEFIITYYLFANDIKFALFQDQLANGGVRVFPVSDITRDDILGHSPPFIQNYLNGPEVISSMPQEFVEYYKMSDHSDQERRRLYRKHISNCVHASIGFSGMISLSDFFEYYRMYYPEDTIDKRELFDEILQMISSKLLFYGFWLDEEAHAELYDIGDSTESLFKTMYLIDVTLVDDGYDEEGSTANPDDYEGEDYFAPYRYNLIERHTAISRRMPSQEEIEGFDIYTFVNAIPEVQELLAFFDAHIPDDEDDVEYGDIALTLVLDGVNLDAPIGYYIEMLAGSGLTFADQKQADAFTSLLTKALNAMPRWANNGHSANELAKNRKALMK